MIKSDSQLESIGFYTLSDARAAKASRTSPLSRCELILTDRCNFKCPYCRGLRQDYSGDMPVEDAVEIIKLWSSDSLKNIRLSGGEPTLYKDILRVVSICKDEGIERIAMSTNGSAETDFYLNLVSKGINDFSISLDACCHSQAKTMSGGIDVLDRISSNIKVLSSIVYVSVGVVITEDNSKDVCEIISYANSLGVSDIRIISSAQNNEMLVNAVKIEGRVLESNPILKYRINNIKQGRNVRGIANGDSNRCGLVMDDMAVCGKWHFPCIIYMREGGNQIGVVSDKMRDERYEWYLSHDTHTDKICKKNCLDVCIDYNNKFAATNPNRHI
jgi:molybdenum cofactor biosynthesis enzyme MoaA